MSYILDALRRADAERQRGAVPGLHAQNVAPLAAPASDRGSRARILAGAGVAAVVVAAAAGGLAWWRSAEPSAAAAQAAPPAVVTVMANPAPAFAPPGTMPMGEGPARHGDAGPAGATATSSLDAPSPEPRPAPADAGRAPPPRAPAADGLPHRYTPPARNTAVDAPGALPGGGATRIAAATPAPAVAATPVPQPEPTRATAPAPAGNGVPRVDTLPASVRAGLPRLAVGGAIYSEVPSARMLILNGQVYHEGEKPAPDTVLQQIRLKSAVLETRGTRYEITF